MKSKIIFMASILAMLLVIPFSLRDAPRAGAQDVSPAAAAVSGYLDDIKARDWDGAYKLTSTSFQNKIPSAAFGKSMEISHIADGLASFQIAETQSGDGVAEVQAILNYSAVGGGKEATPIRFRAVRQSDGWHVDLPSADFLAAKLDMQEVLAQVAHEGVSVSAHYILIYPALDWTQAQTRIRFDIDNQSGRTLEWQLLRQLDTSNYVTDVASGGTFPRQAGLGIVAKKDGGFSVDAVKDGPYVITAAPGSKGAVFLEFSRIPQTVGNMNIALSDFSFVGEDGSWGVILQDVPPAFDLAPMP